MLPYLSFASKLTSKTHSFIAALRQQDFQGEIKADPATRLVLATDNSAYQVMPGLVLFPRSEQDLVHIFTLAATVEFASLKFSLRGGGTGTNGQSLTDGIVIDCSKYLTQIIDVNLDEGWVRVEPGVVLDQLNNFLKPHGFFFPITISTGSRCTLGGMANTNACGKGSTYYGRMLDQVISVRAVLSGGVTFDSKEIDDESLIYQQVKKTVTQHQQEIATRCKQLPRTLTGYTLGEVLNEVDGSLNMNAILVGSEGTLAAFSELTLRIQKIPQYKQLFVIQYQDFSAALSDGVTLIQAKPEAIETVDQNILQLCQSDILFPSVSAYIENPQQAVNALTLVEFVGDNQQQIALQVQRLEDLLQKNPLPARVALKPVNSASVARDLWELRKKSVGLLAKTKDHRKPISGMEDTLVPPQHLPGFITAFRALLDREHLHYGMFGHIDAGCLHVRPALDLSDPKDEALYYKLSSEVAELAQKYHGIMWGEHGKGFRSQFVPQVFGETLFAELCKIKRAFDPHNKLNPGKIAVPSGDATEITALNQVALRGHYDREISPQLKQAYPGAVSCNGNGACFSVDQYDVICPSYKVTRDRVHSPKGRASLVREWLRLQSQTKTSKQRFKAKKKDFSYQVYQAMRGCLCCGACKTQCPVQINVPAFKAKFLSAYYSRYRRQLREVLMSQVETMAHYQRRFPKVLNALMQNSFSRQCAKWLLKLAALPSASDPSIYHWMRKNQIRYQKPALVSEAADAKTVVIIQDWVTATYDLPVLTSTYQLLQALGFKAVLLQPFENGKALQVNGYTEKFRQRVIKNVSYLLPLVVNTVPMVGLDPAITLTYRDEYREHSDTHVNVQLIQEWLVEQDIVFPTIAQEGRRKIVLLMHCTESIEDTRLRESWIALFAKFGLSLEVKHVGCCGMAGSYGHEREHQSLSRALYQMNWADTVEDGGIVLASGFSCRSQIRRFSSKTVLHPMEFLLKSAGTSI